MSHTVSAWDFGPDRQTLRDLSYFFSGLSKIRLDSCCFRIALCVASGDAVPDHEIADFHRLNALDDKHRADFLRLADTK